MSKNKGKSKPMGAVSRSDRIQPTPETALKALPSIVPTLTPEQQWALAQIAGAYALIVAPVVRRRPVADRLPDEIPSRTPSVGERRLSEAQERMLTTYEHWMTRLGQIRRLGCAAAVLEVGVDDKLPWQIDHERRWATGTAAELLIEGLAIYASLRRGDDRGLTTARRLDNVRTSNPPPARAVLRAGVAVSGGR